MTEVMRDVVVLGGGGAGLTAAYRLGKAGLSVTLIEKDNRLGGRTKSGRHNAVAYNSGTQFMLGDVGPVADLRNELAVEVCELDLQPMSMSMKGRYVEAGSDWMLALKLPMSLAAKVSLGWNMHRFTRQAALLLDPAWVAANQDRVAELDATPYSRLLERMHPEARPFFDALVGDFCGNSADTVTAIGGMISTLAITPKFGRRLLGVNGNDALHAALADKSGAKFVQGATVTRVEALPDRVCVTYESGGKTETIDARYVVSALPADIVLKVFDDLPPEKVAALENVNYGPFVTGVFLTNETCPAKWRNFSILSVQDKSFNFVVNQSRPFAAKASADARGSAIFAMAVTDEAKRLAAMSTQETKAVMTHDMLNIFPEMAPFLEEVVVEKWSHGIPCLKPGAFALTKARKAPHGRVWFAGDYVTDFNANLRSAIVSANDCASNIIRLIAVRAN